jgi:CBS domain-containing protein
MKVQDLMTKDVLTIGPEAPLKDVAAILVERGISGLPVCDAERHVIGVISEGDILYKEHDPAGGRRGGPLAWLVDTGPSDAAVAKAQARTVREAMSSPAVTIGPWAGVAEAARLMSERGMNRLPVVRDEELVGIVTRADLVRAFARSDGEIEREILDDVLGHTLWVEPGSVTVDVTRGAVTLNGTLRRRSDAELLERFAAGVPGVLSVSSTLAWEIDDTGQKGRRAMERTVR